MTLNSGGARQADMLWLLTGLKGRVSREPYWLGLLLLQLIGAIVIGPAIRHPDLETTVAAILPFIVLPLLWCQIALVVKRAHDRGITGFVGVLMLVPFANLGLAVFLGLLPGDPGPNGYGNRTNAPE